MDSDGTYMKMKLNDNMKLFCAHITPVCVVLNLNIPSELSFFKCC